MCQIFYFNIYFNDSLFIEQGVLQNQWQQVDQLKNSSTLLKRDDSLNGAFAGSQLREGLLMR